MKILKNKKGQVNDVTYFILLFAIMFIVAVALPYVQSGLQSQYSSQQGFNSSISQNDVNIYNGSSLRNPNPLTASVTLLDVAISVGKMFFWYFSGLPLPLNVFFGVLKLVLAILVFRLIRSGGG